MRTQLPPSRERGTAAAVFSAHVYCDHSRISATAELLFMYYIVVVIVNIYLRLLVMAARSSTEMNDAGHYVLLPFPPPTIFSLY